MGNDKIELEESIPLITGDSLTLVVGKRGCGKSYETFDFLLKQERSLILDINREYDKNGFNHPYFKKPYYLYNTVDEISIDKINDFKRIKRIIPSKDGRIMSLDETFELSKNLLEKYKDGYLLLEDTNKYTSSTDNEFCGLLATLSHSNIKLIMHFNTLEYMSRYVQYANQIRIYSTNDNFRKCRTDKHINILLNKAQQMSYDKNKGGVLVSLDEMKIIG